MTDRSNFTITSIRGDLQVRGLFTVVSLAMALCACSSMKHVARTSPAFSGAFTADRKAGVAIRPVSLLAHPIEAASTQYYGQDTSYLEDRMRYLEYRICVLEQKLAPVYFEPVGNNGIIARGTGVYPQLC